MGANLFAVAMIWAWVPIVQVVFAIRPSRDALIFAFVFGWLFLPGIGFDLPGLPDLTKMSATVVGATLGVLIFDGSKFLSFRPKWYDIPMIAWCLTPFISSITNNMGPYDGFSVILAQTISWGLPYLLGRIYLNDAKGVKNLTLAVVIGAMSYAPFCFLEMRLSAVMSRWVYGYSYWEGERYGGYRPMVFLNTGLELGMWMTMACLMAERLWTSGAVRKLWGYSFGMITLGLFVTTIMCRSTGALCMLLLGLATTWASKFFGKSWPLWLVLLIPPAYCTTRITGTWSGSSAVEISKAVFGEERAQSLEFRFMCEEYHIVRSLKKAFFGYSRANFKVDTGDLHARVIDGYWTVAFGTMGLSGLIAFNGMLLMPILLVIWRFPPKSWGDPQVAPIMALALFLLLFLIDCLSNAMPNPLYAVAMGAVASVHVSGGRSQIRADTVLAEAVALLEEGKAEASIEAFELVVESSTTTRGQDDRHSQFLTAEALAGMGRAFRQIGQINEAEHAFRDALSIRLHLASGAHEADLIADLAASHEELARLLSDLGHPAAAIQERRKALELWATLVSSQPRNVGYRNHRIDSLNDLAWLLATDADELHRDPTDAISLASEAARLAPENPACWNTLGVSRYRSGDWAGAIEALEHSVALNQAGGTAFDHYFLSMACGNLGEIDHARAWFEAGIDWSEHYRPGHAGLASFRAEAASALVGVTGKSIKHLY